MLAAILFFFMLFCGCSGLDSFGEVRDYIMKQSRESWHTQLELAVNTDDMGFISKYIRDIDLDAEHYRITGIDKVEIGVYDVRGGETNLVERVNDIDVGKLTRRLNRAGYDVAVNKRTDEEISVGLIRRSRPTKHGSGYFVHVTPDQFVLVKVDGYFRKY
jgi:hypothetical protein